MARHILYMKREGWQGWDEYAPFYDWENAQTLGRRDVPFWRRLTQRGRGRVLELGCGTGRVSMPLARAGVELVGVDRSAPMLERARAPTRQVANTANSAGVSVSSAATSARCRSTARSFAMVLAPYGILQSLIRPRDLTATLASVARVIAPGGIFGIDLVPDVPEVARVHERVQLRGKAGGAQLTLIESVRQDPTRRLTTFEQRYVERRGRRTREHRFELTFRTLSVPQMTRQLERAGFTVDAVLGDYQGRPWDDRADVWIIIAGERPTRATRGKISPRLFVCFLEF